MNGIIHNNVGGGGDDDQKVKFIVKLLVQDCIQQCWYSNKGNNVTSNGILIAYNMSAHSYKALYFC